MFANNCNNCDFCNNFYLTFNIPTLRANHIKVENLKLPGYHTNCEL